jgi:3-oxoacyl-[acyl-carrier-protein] synthase-1
MADQPLAVLSTGLLTSVGLTAPASCAAIRAKLSNPSPTRFIDLNGEWIMAHSVPMAQPWRGRTKLRKMAASVIKECLAGALPRDWAQIPLLLCVAEAERPGRMEGLDDGLLREVQQELGSQFSALSRVLPQGRVSAVAALTLARNMIKDAKCQFVLIAAVDSLLTWPTLSSFERSGRILTPNNSNGFVPGEGAAAILVGPPSESSALACLGIGVGLEPVNIDSELPLRGEGLSNAIKQALADADLQMHDIDFRITDISGEQYYFKEAALALSRTLRMRKEEFDIWHPAECVGELGAAAGLATIVVADAAVRKGYAAGPCILCHFAADSGQRAATILQLRAA